MSGYHVQACRREEGLTGQMVVGSVEAGWVTFTWWAMMDILCSEGWRLNSTMSSSFMCRSTTSPGCRRRGEW